MASEQAGPRQANELREPALTLTIIEPSGSRRHVSSRRAALLSTVSSDVRDMAGEPAGRPTSCRAAGAKALSAKAIGVSGRIGWLPVALETPKFNVPLPPIRGGLDGR